MSTSIITNAISQNDYNTVKEVINLDKTLVKNTSDGYMKNLLNHAVHHDNTKITKLLLEAGSDTYSYANVTDMHIAALNGNYEIYSLLVDYGFDPLCKDVDDIVERTFVSSGCACGDIKHVHPKVYTFNENLKRSILIDAVHGGNMLIIKDLIERGCNVNNESEYSNRTALHTACEKDNLILIRYLIKNGADINHSKSKLSPACVAIKHNAKRSMKYILSLNPIVSKFNIIQALNNNLDIGIDLLHKYVDFLPLCRMILDDDLEQIEELSDEYIMKEIYNYKYAFYHNDEYNEKDSMFKRLDNSAYLKNSPLMLAIILGNVRIIEHFIYKLKILAEENDVMCAISHDYNIFKMIYQIFMDNVDESNNNETKLISTKEKFFMEAVEKNNIQIVKYLLNDDVDINCSDSYALCHASSNNNYQMVKLLFDCGIKINEKSDIFSRIVHCKKDQTEFQNIINILLENNINSKSNVVLQPTSGSTLTDTADSAVVALTGTTDSAVVALTGTTDSAIVALTGKNILKKLFDDFVGGFFNYNKQTLLLSLLVHNKSIINFDYITDLIKKMIMPERFSVKIRCPADEMNVENNLSKITLYPLIKNIVENYVGCSICMENVALYTLDICNHKIVCYDCSIKIELCPVCRSRFTK